MEPVRVVEGCESAQPWDACKANPGAWCATSEEHADYCLEVLPPIYFAGGFAVSEPIIHDGLGRPVYLCLVQVAGKTYARELAIPDAAREARALRDRFTFSEVQP